MTDYGSQILLEAAKHIGEEYVYGADVPFDNPDYKGPWDCAEFCSWVVYQVLGKVLGCLNNEAALEDLEPFTGGWRRDIVEENGITRVEVREALWTPGAILLRYPNRKHVVFSDGSGGTIEAMGREYGVRKASAWERGWNYAGV